MQVWRKLWMLYLGLLLTGCVVIDGHYGRGGWELLGQRKGSTSVGGKGGSASWAWPCAVRRSKYMTWLSSSPTETLFRRISGTVSKKIHGAERSICRATAVP